MVEKPQEKPIQVEEKIEAPKKGIFNSPFYVVCQKVVNKHMKCYKFVGLFVQSLEWIFFFYSYIFLCLSLAILNA